MESSTGIKVRFRQNMATLLRGAWIMNGRKAMWLGLYGLLLTFLWAFTFRGTDDSRTFGMLVVVFWLACVINWFVSPVMKVRAMLKEPNFAGECELVAEDDHLLAKNGSMETRYDWSSFSKFMERESLLFIQLGKRSFIAIPKSAFDTEDDLARFRGIVTRKIVK